MAFSVNTPVGDGVTKQFAVNFTNGLFSRDSVHVFVEGEVDGLGEPIERTFTWINDGLIELDDAAPAAGVTVNIRRIMDKDKPAVDFEDGEILTEETMDRSQDHLLNSIHELLDGYGFENVQTDMRLNGNSLINVGDVEAENLTIGGIELTDSVALAERWANEDEDVIVEPGKYSARHFAIKAEASADRVDLGALDQAVADAELAETNATGSAQQALSSADLAEGFANSSAFNADRAEADADRAEAARDAAFVNADVYPDVATGLAAVADGDQFQVAEGDELVRYRRDSVSTQTEVARYFATEGVLRASKMAADTVRYMARESRPVTAPKFGWVDGSPVNGADTTPGVVVLSTPAAANTTISRIKLFAGSNVGDLEISAYTRSGDTFTRSRVLAKITIKAPHEENVFDSLDFAPFDVTSGEYIGFAASTSGRITYIDLNEPPLGYFYASYSARAEFTDAAASFGPSFQIGFYGNENSAEIEYLASLASSSKRSDTILGQITSTYADRLGAAGSLVGTSSSFSGTFIIGVPASSYGVINSGDIGVSGTGTLTVAVFDRVSDLTFLPVLTKDVSVISGNNNVTLDLEIFEGQHLGVIVPSAIKITSEATSSGHDGYFSSTSTSVAACRVSASNSDQNRRIDMGFNATLYTATVGNSNEGLLPWSGEALTTFGDSITWYYGRTFSTSHVEAGQPVVGYQKYIADRLGCSIINQGNSGWTLPQIYNGKISTYDFTSAFAVTITSGANDHRKGVLPGLVAGVGATFDTATFAGALQASVEKIINTNKETKIFLITPIRGYYFESGTSNVPGPYNNEMEISRDYINIMEQVGDLYGIPVIDWYDSTSLNELNYSYWLGDDPNVFTAYALHPRNRFFEVMGKIAAEQMWLYKQ